MMNYNGKIINENYIRDEKTHIPLNYNIRNKPYIDNWVKAHYQDLMNKFRRYNTITKEGYDSQDILQESIIRIYINRKKYKSQEDCDNDLNNFFKIKDYGKEENKEPNLG